MFPYLYKMSAALWEYMKLLEKKQKKKTINDAELFREGQTKRRRRGRRKKKKKKQSDFPKNMFFSTHC